MDLAAISNDPELLRFALAGGEAAFGDNCAPCHGRGAQGAVGYPNLRDDSWLWGDGSLAAIHQTILHGIRADDPETQTNQMPAFGRTGDSVGAADPDVAEYVLSLSGKADDKAAAERGAKIFAANCAACHGADGKGNPQLGAPNLDRRALALCRRQADGDGDHPQRPRRRHAGLGQAARSRDRSRSLPSTSIRLVAAASREGLQC